VPYDWAEDKQLGSWVSKQRTLKHKLDRGEPSQGMTAERAARLDALGFTWDPAGQARDRPGRARPATLTTPDGRHGSALLAAYKATHGDCNVAASLLYSRKGRKGRRGNSTWLFVCKGSKGTT
jgi:hypothetical protein